MASCQRPCPIGTGRDVAGLLGNADGDTANDLALRDGTVLAQPVAFDVLYGAFADDWRITDASSLFEYENGLGTADFTDLSFPAAGVTLDDFPLEVVAAAEAAAAGIEDPALRKAAVLDYLVSGNTDYIDAAMAVDDAQEAPLQETTVADAPEIASGIGISVSQAELTEGDAGSQSVTFTIFRTGDLSGPVELDYAIGGDVDAADYAALPTGSLTLMDGQASVELAVDVLADTTFEDNEALEMSFVLTGDAAPIILSSSAMVEIVNDDLAPPPEPELNPVEGTGGSDNLMGTDGDDLITGFGGRYDRLTGKMGADTFVFGTETTNGSRERDLITDYEVGVDSILLTDGAEIASIRTGGGSTVVLFEGDRDVLYIRGDGVTSDNLTIVYDDPVLL